ncbi:hypothetical protein [Rhodococcus sp. BS-15]|uniref:hypothetical protein n=1 Tax=Rhodococcus sp. BS-15 TaxID=1304954 RepID=UPI000FFB5450|nr:hypothetical protein [Rhodococcus sp. BS-15]
MRFFSHRSRQNVQYLAAGLVDTREGPPTPGGLRSSLYVVPAASSTLRHREDVDRPACALVLDDAQSVTQSVTQSLEPHAHNEARYLRGVGLGRLSIN